MGPRISISSHDRNYLNPSGNIVYLSKTLDERTKDIKRLLKILPCHVALRDTKSPTVNYVTYVEPHHGAPFRPQNCGRSLNLI